ncbi:GNAT family N-acetyltransferase [Psychrobacillus sp. NEAU-3TGS]|uniref:GNAT family N-acetyltransferase n=1 Tax=Psychrobacillus sp. NEAU-3TGS TaxID=2995412 RepID=UPI002498DE44|nr:GNAT family N-acetyltransferase [Psychrobacillus sp. NEAU-3TGS]MDI2586252.1 GNAT family N-acetyltransferase [Psychrobacillus sp. NEAU-3TGS]
MEFTSERLLFRSYTQDDFDFLYGMLSDPDMVCYIGNGETRDLKGAEVFLEWIYSQYEMNSEYGLKVVVRKEDNVPVGHAGIVPQKVKGKDELEVGYWIAKKYWGNGYASEAAKAFLHRGEKQLGVDRFISLIQQGNKASRKVAAKNGMSVEAEIIFKGHNVYVYSN